MPVCQDIGPTTVSSPTARLTEIYASISGVTPSMMTGFYLLQAALFPPAKMLNGALFSAATPGRKPGLTAA
jgi:hypothetical protein